MEIKPDIGEEIIEKLKVLNKAIVELKEENRELREYKMKNKQAL